MPGHCRHCGQSLDLYDTEHHTHCPRCGANIPSNQRNCAMSRYPAATWRPVTRYQPGGSARRATFTARRLILHTAVSNATPSMHSFFDVSGRATPHFYVGRDGEVEQYIDTAAGSSANLEGNPDCITVETWDGYGATWNGGAPGPRWTAKQVQALAALAAWCHEVHGIPLVKLPSSLPGTRGIGWHRQGIDGNFPAGLLSGRVSGGERWSTSTGKVCPTDTRIHQVVEEILPLAISIAKPKHVPVEVAFANLNLYQGGDSRHIAHLCESADVLLLVECIDVAGRPIPVADYLPQGWECAQDTSTSAKAGSVVAWKTASLKAVRGHKLHLLTDEVLVGDRVRTRTRYVMVQTLKVVSSGEKFRFASGHFPPDDGPEWRATWPAGTDRVKNLRRRPLLAPLVAGFDRNDEIDAFADDVNMLAEGRGIVGVLYVPGRVRATASRIDTWAKDNGLTDHVDIFVTVERK